MRNLILTLNAGSSSLKFALFESGAEPKTRLRGGIGGIGSNPVLQLETADGEFMPSGRLELDPDQLRDAGDAMAHVLTLIDERVPDGRIAGIGHRVVHGGMTFDAPVIVTEKILANLESLVPLARLHQPFNIEGIRLAQERFPEAHQVACFDTSFHRSHPWVNDTFGLPMRFYDEGVRRYGFHGLSYEYISMELERIAKPHADGRVVAAHLGNGSSMCAIRDGQSVGSTMGFTAYDGLPMGTRCGQLDPGVVLYLMREHGMDDNEIEILLGRESGLKGLSGLSNDIRVLEEAATPQALAAIDYFVFRVRRELGAMTAVLSGLDALVFCGGIGENSWHIREQICEGFEWIGIELDANRNRHHETIISSDRSRVRVFLIHTNEEIMIARHTAALLGISGLISRPD